MPRNTNTVIENNFIGGLVTQATALNFPPNAAIAQSNCIFNERGIVSRRFGMDFENNYQTNTQNRTGMAQSSYYWKNASGDGLTNLVVQQNGGTLSFYNTNSNQSLSAGLSANTVSLSSFQASGATTDNLNQNECQYSTGLGYLFVVHPYCDPFYVQFVPSTGTFTSSIITFTTRDVFGIIEPGVLPDTRPTTLSANHEYNLINQGWDVPKINTFATATQPPSTPVLTAATTGGSLATGTVYVKLTFVNQAGETLTSTEANVAVTGPNASVKITAPTVSGSATGYNVYASGATGTEVLQNGATPVSLTTNYTITSLTTGTASPPASSTAVAYPSNADVWWNYNNASQVFSPSTTLPNIKPGSSPAPQGYIRLNPWNSARSSTCLAQSGVSLTLTGTVDQTSGALRPTVTEFHAGRIWYAGVNASGYNGLIYFTRVVQDQTDFGWCAATNDPTSQTLFTFVASDGGALSIPQAGAIFRLISLGPNLIVFGANGVWAVTGSRGIGFSADDYNIANISYIRSIAGTSYVVAEGNIYWWNGSDINILSQGDTGYQVQSISYDKIKDFFIGIPLQSKKFARGAYNPRTHLIHWLYTSNAPSDPTSTYTYDTVLTHNLLSKAFYTWTIDTTQASINSVVVIEGAGSVVGSSPIVDNLSDIVTDSLGNPLVTYNFSSTQVQTVTKFLCSYVNGSSYNFTFAESIQTAYKDWVYLSTGIDYTSTFTTGYLVKTQGERRFQSNYIFVFNDLANIAQEGLNSYTFQAMWDYGAVGNSGQWTQKQTITQTIVHNETNFNAGRRRLKVRGSGISIQFKFTSVSGKPFYIIGWSTYDTSNAQP